MKVQISLLRNVMLVLALNESFAASSKMWIRAAVSTSTKAPLAHGPTVLGFSMLPHRTRTSRSRMMSSSTDVEVSSEQLSHKTSPDKKTGSLLHTVMVQRNRQSAAFREGTPLIFGGSVAATFTEQCDVNSLISDDETIPMGSIVAVVVSRDSSTEGRPKKDFRGKRRNQSSNRKEHVVPHHSISTSDNEKKQRDMINQSQLIGYGVFNPESMYRVRMLCHDTIHPGLTKSIRSIRKNIQRGNFQSVSSSGMGLDLILERKISDAIYTRLAMQLPSASITDTYRLVNGEGDGLSGLAVDILGGATAIVMSSAAWCEIHKETILSVLGRMLKEHPSYADTSIDIVWRNTPSRLKQDGYEVDIKSSGGTDEKDENPIVATESSVKYLTYPHSDGQKTGFYCDQRANRLMVAELCQNKRVLDLCCYNGGFALNAMIRGCAASSIGVDSSQDAINAAMANAELNGLSGMDVSFVKDDISAFMKGAMDADNEFDVIVLDPPKLAPSLSSLDKASRKYHALNRDAMNLIDRSQGGLLLTCTCSAAMSQKDGGQYFLSMVNKAALSAKRRVTLLRVSGAAPCHTQSPASFPAGQYLTAALFHVGPADV
mmetsp:Transcript_23190/g.55935  ORF Transcript_23190/g.55935 Transcript_23190/m.55935 type:complete len:601 (-) Transcript_23190:54-1856(-)